MSSVGFAVMAIVGGSLVGLAIQAENPWIFVVGILVIAVTVVGLWDELS